MAASIALGCGGKALVCWVTTLARQTASQVRDPFTFLSSAILLFSENGSLLMAPFGHAEAVATCPLWGMSGLAQTLAEVCC